MSDFSTFVAQIMDFSNRQDWSQALVTSFIRMAEQKCNSELRVDRMICVAVNTVTEGCAPLPDSWLESDFMQIAAQTPMGWRPIQYMPRDKFFRLGIGPYVGPYAAQAMSTFGHYTIEGRTIYFGGAIDDVEGTQFQLSYYSEVPVFSDTQDSYIYTKYPSLYLFAALMHSDLYAVGEEAKAAQLKQLAEDTIAKLNADHLRARASGSRLARGRVRSFG